jgi:hypothetical protein
MDTDELIDRLAADPRRPAPSLSIVWWGAASLAVALAAVVFFATLGPRLDFAVAAETPRFLFKFVVTTTLAVSSFALVRALSRPGETAWRKAAPFIATPPALMIIGVVAELLVLPPELRAARMVGTNSLVCLTFIPLIGIGPLAIAIYALRYGAPIRPARAGAVAGVLAGAIAATFYAAHCTDDSPLFVAIWYTIAIGGLALFGAAAAGKFARW